MEWIWLGVIVSLILIELISMNFTAIWFVISSIISYIMLKLNQNYAIQVTTFLLIGVILIIFVRPRIINRLLTFRDNFLKKITTKYPFFKKFISVDINIKEDKKVTKKTNKKKKNSVKKK